jgi:lambda repressor-like predicted transcriptional regulator
MRTEDLKTFAEMGKAFWQDSRRSERLTVETISAVSLLDLTPERALERAASTLLGRALREGMATNAADNVQVINQPFYRLRPLERFLMVALHLGRWSYGRLSRILGVPVEQVEQLAWNARLQLATSQPYPTGSKLNANCPEYDPKRPWTQRFLDEEIASGRERIFLQNHLMACDFCRETLGRCRDFYYSLEKQLPREETDSDLVRNLESVCERGADVRSPATASFASSVAPLLNRRDIQLLIAAVMMISLYQLFLR